jgi:hypothetical protein
MKALYDLIEQIGAEFVSNSVQARVDGQMVTLARMIDNEFVLTEDGQKVIDAQRGRAKSRKQEE